jgi:hypothetical protein
MQPRTPRSYALAVPTATTREKALVPLYMVSCTVHGGATVGGVADAYAADLKVQGAHDVRYRRYWLAEAESKICGWRCARVPWALRTGTLELIVIKSDWDATHQSPHEGVQEQAPRLDNGARSARCAHSI